LATLAWLLALLAGLLLPAALLAFFAALLILLAALVRILIFVRHFDRLLGFAPEPKPGNERNVPTL
jgi:hypothetical protein